MDLALEPDIYSPNIDDKGNYVDKIPSFTNLKNGIRCPCGTRKDKTYDCTAYFTTHIKTKTHQKWLTDLNTNKANYYTENIQLKETICSQRQIIANLEKEKAQIQRENNENIKLIAYLTKKSVQSENPNLTLDLLDFD
jgi:predicted RNase H-like nuclease (RuvC/YqgF family)